MGPAAVPIFEIVFLGVRALFLFGQDYRRQMQSARTSRREEQGGGDSLDASNDVIHCSLR
jgi:hypothetical protein